MRAVFTTQPGIGHYRPLVAFARALERAGHAVTIACAPRFHDEVKKTGLHCVAAGLDYLLSDVSKTFPDMPPPGPLRAPKMLAMWREGAAIAMARDLIAIAEELKPDVIVHEGSEFGASIAAERIGVPHVTAGALWFRPDMVAPTEEAIQRFDLAPDAVGQFRHLGLAVMARSWVAPDEPVPSTVMFVQSEAIEPSSAAVPAWLRDLPCDRPLVHVTMGTTEVNRTPGLYETILAGLRDEPISLVVATGNDPAALGPQPEHVRVESFVSHGALLPRCRAVVTHGGHGTLMACFALGIPVVVVPINADQPRNAARCEALGVGRAVPPGSRNPDAIRDALREVLTDERYAQRARGVGDEMAALPSYDDAVRAIEEVARRFGRTSRSSR
jgi:UDP:flavonoid glycosyltransferase YjiC (YdhE family)